MTVKTYSNYAAKFDQAGQLLALGPSPPQHARLLISGNVEGSEWDLVSLEYRLEA
jgi:hypothetical protein